LVAAISTKNASEAIKERRSRDAIVTKARAKINAALKKGAAATISAIVAGRTKTIVIPVVWEPVRVGIRLRVRS
jgi:hypothetical protein